MKMWKKHLNMPTIRKQAGALTALALAVLLACSFIPSMKTVYADNGSAETDSAEDGGAMETVLADGTYEITASMQSAANKDKASMGNAALKKPLQLKVKNGEGTLSMEFVTMTVTLGTAEFKGYLGSLGYLLSESDSAPASSDKVYPATVTAYYNVYDSYNDPDTGTDANVKGSKYPKKAEIPVTIGDDFIWVQVYVPVMESVTSGAGRQYARLVLDWDSVTEVTETADETASDKTVSTDRSELKSQIAAAKKLVAKGSVYTTASLNALKTALRNAQTIYKDKSADQTEIDAQTISLLKAKAALKKRVNVDKSGLKTQLKKARAAVKKTGTYTAATRKVLKEAITNAAAVYQDADATAKEVSKQVAALKAARKGLVRKDAKKLNKNKLADGSYTLYGAMVKTDKSTASMANEAISHQIRLTVKNGAYYLTVEFQSMKINSQNGYLGKLYYYKTGFSLDSYGNPKGTLAAVSVDAYQTENGKKVSDSLGTDYPAKVTFPLIGEGIKNGYVPLQVFVPVMDAISAGTGTQSVYLKLDWTTLKLKSSGTGSLNEEKVKSDSQKEVTAETSADSEKEQTNETKSVDALRSMTSLPAAEDGEESQETTGSTLQNTLVNGVENSSNTQGTGAEQTETGQTGTEEQTGTEQTALSAGSAASASAAYVSGTAQNSSGADLDVLLGKLLPVLLSALSVAMGVIYKIWSRRS